MAISANTTSPLIFLRRFGGITTAPQYQFASADISGTTILVRAGAAMVVSAATGHVIQVGVGTPTAVAINTISAASSLVGFAASGNASAPPFPTAAGFSQGTRVIYSPP